MDDLLVQCTVCQTPPHSISKKKTPPHSELNKALHIRTDKLLSENFVNNSTVMLGHVCAAPNPEQKTHHYLKTGGSLTGAKTKYY